MSEGDWPCFHVARGLLVLTATPARSPTHLPSKRWRWQWRCFSFTLCFFILRFDFLFGFSIPFFNSLNFFFNILCMFYVAPGKNSFCVFNGHIGLKSNMIFFVCKVNERTQAHRSCKFCWDLSSQITCCSFNPHLLERGSVVPQLGLLTWFGGLHRG